MARKITMFEMHFDGARFGPTFGNDEPADIEETTDDEPAETQDEADSESGSRLRALLIAAGVVALGTVVGRRALGRFRGGDDTPDVGIEDAETTERVVE